MDPFKNGGFILVFLSLVLVITDADPRPTNLNIGSSGGGYSSGGLNSNKMIFTVQDARKLVANKMRRLKNFGGGSGRKHPPPKKHKGHHDSHGHGEYHSDHHAHGSDKGGYYVVNPYGYSNGYGREQTYVQISEVKKPDKRQVGWTPIVKYENELPNKEASSSASAYEKVVAKTEARENPSDAPENVGHSAAEGHLQELGEPQAVQNDQPIMQYFQEPKLYRKVYLKAKHPRS